MIHYNQFLRSFLYKDDLKDKSKLDWVLAFLGVIIAVDRKRGWVVLKQNNSEM